MPSSALTSLPALTLDTRLLPPAERLETWRGAIPQYEAEQDGEPDEEFRVLAKAWFLGDLVVTHTVVSAVTLRRTNALIGADGSDTCNLHVLLTGSWTGEIDGQEITVGPGQLVGFDLSRPFTVHNEASESVSVIIGRNILQDSFKGEPALHGHIFDGAAGMLLSDHCLALARHLPYATSADATAIVQSTMALLVAALPTAQSSPSADEAGQNRIRREVRRYIDRHIGSANLSPEVVQSALGLTRTALYRSFRSVGGVAAYIQKRRLQAVRALLLHPSETRTIRDIAESLGFPSNSHFAAAFRREFGCSPRELRTTQRTPIGPGDTSGPVSSQFQSWLAGLGGR